MSADLPYPAPESLQRGLTKVGALIGRPFEEYLDEDSLGRMAFTGNRSIVAASIRHHLGELDSRVRFVAGTADGLPSGTIKLINARKAAEVGEGARMRELLDGGFVAVTVLKHGSPNQWELAAMHTFMPEGRALKDAEAALQSLVTVYERHDKLSHLRATDAWPFQIRTGPGGYWIYFLAQRYFSEN